MVTPGHSHSAISLWWGHHHSTSLLIGADSIQHDSSTEDIISPPFLAKGVDLPASPIEIVIVLLLCFSGDIASSPDYSRKSSHPQVPPAGVGVLFNACIKTNEHFVQEFKTTWLCLIGALGIVPLGSEGSCHEHTSRFSVLLSVCFNVCCPFKPLWFLCAITKHFSSWICLSVWFNVQLLPSHYKWQNFVL